MFKELLCNSIQYDFHISRACRIKYGIEESLFSIRGKLIISNPRQARIVSENLNKKRREEGKFDQLVSPGMVNGLGLLHEIMHYLLRVYEDTVNPGVFSRGINYLKNNLGEEELNILLLEIIKEFPPADVYNNNISPQDYLAGQTEGKSNKEIILEETILLHLENINPAAASLQELFSDRQLSQRSRYPELNSRLESFFAAEKTFGPENLPLILFLRKPIVNNPYSLEGQLDYIRDNWGIYIKEKFLDRLLKGKDLIYEDYRLFTIMGGGEKSTPPVPKYEYDQEFFDRLKAKLARGEQLTPEESQFYYAEIEQFTTDIEWMPKVVMLAKNIYVWLDQLSKKYQRSITRLDQIPDEELNIIAGWNFTSIWLIGIWERSSASRKIKQIMGNPEAASSAYSLYDYVIAEQLGGEEAFQNLKSRAWQRNIRLASDMVPNHTGIYSKWVVEKPYYFIQTDNPPYPGYSFHSQNLSDDNRVEVRIEDKYYSRSDAAVVFQRRDTYSGDVKYIYHGNDGTHMPWNDTAQLNLLLPEVREALIQTIMHVARKTPIIRFDAAMTLAKKHYQRLWFPQPGTGGAIPSRSDYSLTRAEFDLAMPIEFWREVVDRINAEMPNTLLLAEAFWLMEGYFVRTLGMHRVYNSAFMHMLMKEENDKYRQLMKNTLEFNPEILKRYVNFMSNPDEETAVNQFGKGDKYFGAALMMVTLPGLPMFAHGQIEGFAEKYGMEYQRAYYNEYVDDYLVHRHIEEIFPLMKKRYLFSQVENFYLYDFYDNQGNVNENVFAYSNRMGDERTLIVYNNSYSECKGTICLSTEKSSGGQLLTTNLADALAINSDDKFYYIYYDHKTKLEYINSGRDIREYGFFFSLFGYEYKTFINFREIYDASGEYEKLALQLGGRGVHSIDYALLEMNLAPIYSSFESLLSDEIKIMLGEYLIKPEAANLKLPVQLIDNISHILDTTNHVKDVHFDKENVLTSFKEDIRSASMMEHTLSNNKLKNKKKSAAPEFIEAGNNLFDFLVIMLIDNIAKHDGEDNLFSRLKMEQVFYRLNIREHLPIDNLESSIKLIKAITNKDKTELWRKEIQALFSRRKKIDSKEKISLVKKILAGNDMQEFINYNEYQGTAYFSKERFELLMDWLSYLTCAVSAKDLLTNDNETSENNNNLEVKAFLGFTNKVNNFCSELKKTSALASYKYVDFLNLLAPVDKNTTVKKTAAKRKLNKTPVLTKKASLKKKR